MKAKKKSSADTKKSMKKEVSLKPLMLIDKTVATTKQKTHTTIQDHLQIGEAKKSARANKNITHKKALSRKMELCDLSSFSGSERSSLSPQYQRKKSPIDKQPKEKKKNKSKSTLAIEKQLEKRKKQVNHRQSKKRQSQAKQQAHQSQYEKLFMRKLGEKKITQMSEQSQVSVPKISKLQISIPQYAQQSSTIKSNGSIIRQLKHRINQKYRKVYPGLHKKQLNFYCFVVLIQRMWKQYKIKKFISNFFTPRASIVPVTSADSHRENNTSKLDLSLTTQEQTLEIIRKYIHDNPLSERKMIMERELHSTEMETVKKRQRKSSLDQLEISTELTPQKQAKFIKFVECLRDISFHKPKPQETRSKIDVFNLQSSLSQSCLMQKFYNKIFKDSPIKRNNFQIFSIKREQRLLQHSIQLINTLKPAEQIEDQEIIEVSQRFETESPEVISKDEHKVEKVDISVETDEVQEPKQINTLKQLNNVAQGVVLMLLSELYQEKAFQCIQKSLAKKKRRGHMPGLYITRAKIHEYLAGLSTYMLDNYGNDVIRRFRTVNPLSILKIHHEYDDQEDYYEDQQSEFDLPIIPNTLFYEYQVIYEEQNFVIPQDARKFINFLQGLIKIHNLLLRDCLAENLQKNKIDRCVLPWDQNSFPHRSNLKQSYGRHEVQQDLNKTIQKICSFAFLGVGQFHRSVDDPINIRRMNQLWKEEQDEANDWNSRYEYLQSRIEIAKMVEQELFQEVIKEILIFF